MIVLQDAGVLLQDFLYPFQDGVRFEDILHHIRHFGDGI